MPKVVKANPSGKTEKTTKLGEVQPGQVFRFPGVTFEEALAKEDGAGFFQVIKMQPEKAKRVTIMSTDGLLVQEKDDDHQVIVHPAELVVSEAPRA